MSLKLFLRARKPGKWPKRLSSTSRRTGAWGGTSTRTSSRPKSTTFTSASSRGLRPLASSAGALTTRTFSQRSLLTGWNILENSGFSKWAKSRKSGDSHDHSPNNPRSCTP
ncbi:hypothetical protein X802_01060 [Thermococcus guaymasensis DSM 11113]|uniref:Uncharacterized protein n=1 Tax=Thermococcus guaymasensis DSM 11113 TaxID=1432656 RepID=A0A0X1KI45_9EURY|nr:hypothetical protein X802_01060 [Thermococcus guaymasensis DSM 11113]